MVHYSLGIFIVRKHSPLILTRKMTVYCTDPKELLEKLVYVITMENKESLLIHHRSLKAVLTVCFNSREAIGDTERVL